MTSAAGPRFVLLDLLMATMDSMSVWAAATGDRERGLQWRDAVTARMIAVGRYLPYERLVADAATELGLDGDAPDGLWSAWEGMRAWPDAAVLHEAAVPYAFVTNCSAALANRVVETAGLAPAFLLSAEEAGWYKPRPQAYRAACARAGERPEAIRFVAGAPFDAEGATRAGLDTVLVIRRPDVPAPAGTRVVTSLSEAIPRV